MSAISRCLAARQGLVRRVRESGRTMERVHIVSEPVTDYIRFSLLHGYPASVEAGEDVRILGVVAAHEAGLGRDDFWLFDNDLAAMSTEWDGAKFRKADDSNDVGYVEIAFHSGKIGIRDSKDHGTGPVLGFTEHEWECFIQGAKNGRVRPAR
jgi:hypothetical protein